MKITLKGKNNVYEQIVNEYKKYIELGIIIKDEKLPSCRTLGKELGINPNTVVKAYDVLEKEGYIVSLPKKGAYVIYDKQCNIDNINEEIKSLIIKYKDKVNYDNIIQIINDIYGRN